MRTVIVFVVNVALVGLFVSPTMAQFEGYWEQMTIKIGPWAAMVDNIDTTSVERVSYKKQMMKTISLLKSQEIIVRLDKGLVWRINHNDTTYTELTFTQMEAGRKKMQEVADRVKGMGKAGSQLINLLKKQFQEQGGPGTGNVFEQDRPTLTVNETDERQEVNEYECRHMILSDVKKTVMEMWVTDTFDVGAKIFDMYQAMGTFMYQIPEDLKQFRGFIMRTVTVVGEGAEKMTLQKDVTNVVEKAISDSEFEIPEGYRKVEISTPQE